MAARTADVAVAGAGPTGLFPAAELALAGVPCHVLERRQGLRTDSRAICLHARSMEMLDLRGQAGTFTAAGIRVRSFPLGLKGAAIDLARLVVLDGEPLDQRGDLGADRRAACLARVGPFPGDQAAVPPEHGSRGDQPV